VEINTVGTSAMDITVQLMQKLNYLRKFQDNNTVLPGSKGPVATTVKKSTHSQYLRTFLTVLTFVVICSK